MINPLKRTLFRFFFCIESCVFIWTYVFGIQGIHVIIKTRRENITLAQQVLALQNDISHLEDKIAQWKKFPFFKEKYAREQLQMAHEHDVVYFIE